MKNPDASHIQNVHARNNAHDPTGHIADTHARNRQPPPDVFERRVIQEKNRQIVDANAAIGKTYGGSYDPPPNPYGGPPSTGFGKKRR